MGVKFLVAAISIAPCLKNCRVKDFFILIFILANCGKRSSVEHFEEAKPSGQGNADGGGGGGYGAVVYNAICEAESAQHFSGATMEGGGQLSFEPL